MIRAKRESVPILLKNYSDGTTTGADVSEAAGCASVVLVSADLPELVEADLESVT